MIRLLPQPHKKKKGKRCDYHCSGHNVEYKVENSNPLQFDKIPSLVSHQFTTLMPVRSGNCMKKNRQVMAFNA